MEEKWADIDGYDPSFVSKVCRGDKSIAYGYIWRFK